MQTGSQTLRLLLVSPLETKRLNSTFPIFTADSKFHALYNISLAGEFRIDVNENQKAKALRIILGWRN